MTIGSFLLYNYIWQGSRAWLPTEDISRYRDLCQDDVAGGPTEFGHTFKRA